MVQYLKECHFECFIYMSIFLVTTGPKEFVEPDLTCMPVPRPLSPETVNKKDGSLETEKRQKKEGSFNSFLFSLIFNISFFSQFPLIGR